MSANAPPPGKAQALARQAPHTTQAQREQACLRANRFDVCAGQLGFLHDELLEINVLSEGHLRRANLEDMAPGLLIGKWELNLAVKPTRPQKSGIKSVCAIGGHNDFDMQAK